MFKPIVCKDHNGTEYPSMIAMLTAWNITWSAWRSRTKKGWSLEKILTTPVGKAPVMDHTGQEHASMRAMADAWGIPSSRLISRLRAGWDIEDALTKPPEGAGATDHKGNEYKSFNAMAAAYGQSSTGLRDKLKRGMSLKDALESTFTAQDHEGNKFRTTVEMCEHWNIGRNTYHSRINKGWAVKQALETPMNEKPRPVTDHDGTPYKNCAAMCRAYGINKATYLSRIEAGWSQEQALTIKNAIKKNCRDWAGREYSSVTAMSGGLCLPKHSFYTQYAKCRDYVQASIDACSRYWPGTAAGEYDILKCVSFPWFLCVAKPDPNPDIHAGELLLHADTILALKQSGS